MRKTLNTNCNHGYFVFLRVLIKCIRQLPSINFSTGSPNPLYAIHLYSPKSSSLSRSTKMVLSIAVIVFILLPSGLNHVTLGVGSPSDTQFNSTLSPTRAKAADVLICTMTAGPVGKEAMHGKCLGFHLLLGNVETKGRTSSTFLRDECFVQ